jgi:hypothetical protein
LGALAVRAGAVDEQPPLTKPAVSSAINGHAIRLSDLDFMRFYNDQNPILN